MADSVSRLVVPISKRDHLRGPIAAPVTLVEYGDFQCAVCAATFPIVEEIVDSVGDQLCFAYRHFPRPRIHARAEPAAEAAEAAAVQGRFWQMHNLLFRHQDALEDEDLLDYARVLRLDLGRFAPELATGLHAPRVRDPFLSGLRSGVNATPTFFINEVRHDGASDFQSLLVAVTGALEATHVARR